jgi:hypothetical protein
MASLFGDLGLYLYDTFSGGKGTTDESAEEIENAGKAYQQQMADIAKNTKSAKELYQEGKETAAAAANNKAGLAMKNAKAAAMMNSGSKLLSAIQGAEAANKASQEGYDTTAAQAAGLAGQTQAQKNAALQSGAQSAYESSVAASQMRAKQAQERANADKNRMANIGTAFIQGLSE